MTTNDRPDESGNNVASSDGKNVLARLPRPVARGLAVGISLISTSSVPVAAQSTAELGAAMCGTGIGVLVGLVFIGAALFYALKGIARAMSALDKMGSTKQQDQLEGKEALAGAGKTASAAFIPAFAAGIFEVLGINTVSCLSPSSWTIIFVGFPV